MQTSELTPERLRALADTRPEQGLVLSLYLNLDPREFATGPARDTAINSLLDDAERQVAEGALEHDEEVAVREDLQRARDYLEGELDATGAHGVALFACSPVGLWETVKLARPVESSVLVDVRPAIEPLADIADATRWAVLLVNRRTARILRGTRDGLFEVASREDRVHGQHRQGGPSQTNRERSIEHDVDVHIKETSDDLLRRFQRRSFDALLIGAPEEMVHHVEEKLHPYLRERLAGRVSVDVENSSTQDVLAAAEEIFVEHEVARERDAVERLRATLGQDGRAAAGWDAVLTALNEKRVDSLLLGAGETGGGLVCPHCGWLGTDGEACPVDGYALGRRDDVAEAAVEAAVRQSATVIRLQVPDALETEGGIGALLRF